MRKILVLGCLAGASFFIGCNQTAKTEPAEGTSEKKELEMYEESELALLMRNMYEENMDMRKKLQAGELPESFPQDFKNIHTAVATKGMIHDRNTFDALADQYVTNMEQIEKAPTPEHAKIAYNEMVLTCASCHKIYCQGPLAKIKKMKIPMDD